MAQIYSIRQTQTAGEWVVRQVDALGRQGVEYIIQRRTAPTPAIRARAQDDLAARRALLAGLLGNPCSVGAGPAILVNPGPIGADPEMDNTIPA